MRLSKLFEKIEKSLDLAWHKAAAPHIPADAPINNDTLEKIAKIPTKILPQKVDDAFWQRMKDKDYMRVAVLMQKKGDEEGGCAIGAIIKDNETGRIIGKGHNRHIQEDRVYWHGETDAVQDAGTGVDFSNATMFTTLTPCAVCTSLCISHSFPRVVIGNRLISNKFPDGANVENEKRLRDKDVEIVYSDDQMGIDIYAANVARDPERDRRDWQGEAGVQRMRHENCNHG